MAKSNLAIHKEIEKKKYNESPLGQIEKKLRKFYDNCILTKTQLPENLAKEVYDLRTFNENRTKDYIDERLKKDRDQVDDFLLETMTKELAIIEKFNA